MALSLRGRAYKLAKDYPAAITAFRKALKLDRTSSPDSKGASIDLYDLGEAERVSGDLDAAEREFREALRMDKAGDDREGIAACTGKLAAVALDREDWRGAEGLAREALALSERVGRQELIALNHNRLAMALGRQDRKPEALPHAWRAVEVLAALRSPHVELARRTLAECQE